MGIVYRISGIIIMPSKRMLEPEELCFCVTRDNADEFVSLSTDEIARAADRYTHLVVELISYGLHAKHEIVGWYAIKRDELGLVQSNPCDEPSWFGMSRFGRK